MGHTEERGGQWRLAPTLTLSCLAPVRRPDVGGVGARPGGRRSAFPRRRRRSGGDGHVRRDRLGPRNPPAPEAGIEDSVDEGIDYLMSLSHGYITSGSPRILVETGPVMVNWLHAKTRAGLRLVRGYPDYHPEYPGSKPGGGRSLEPDPASRSCASGKPRSAHPPLAYHLLLSETIYGELKHRLALRFPNGPDLVWSTFQRS